ncbi:uncharacterized protein LOC143277420 [Babylonia areolata]|uniref:uncharacterized protein LOC143277420 n=1 Tax=Babylonia areolata TaxID=304850 RepID=UPI003FD68942
MHSRGWRAGPGPCVLLLILSIGISRSHVLRDKNIDYLGNQEKNKGIQTQLFHLQNELGSILEQIVAMDHRFNALDHRITALDHRVNSLDQRLSALGQSGAASRSSASDTAGKKPEVQNDGNHDNDEVGHPEPMKLVDEDVSFRLTRVTKTDAGYVYVITLEYQSAEVPDIVVKIASFPVQVNSPDPGKATVYIPKQSEEKNRAPWVYFVFPDHFFSLRLNLTSSAETMDIPRVTLKIARGDDVTFQSGHDAQMNFALHVEGDASVIESERAEVRFLRKSKEEKDTVERLHFFYVDSDFTGSGGVQPHLVNVEGRKGYRQGTVLVNASHGSDSDAPEGVMEAFVTLTFSCSINCLVKQMTKQHHVSLYREDHPGPFPDSFIGFVRDDYKRNGTHVRCDLRPHARPCAILCEAAGSRVTSVEIEKVLPPAAMPAPARGFGGRGVDRAAHTRQLSVAGKGGYWGGAVLMFEQLGQEDAGDYLCMAQSGKETVTKVITLVVNDGWED